MWGGDCFTVFIFLNTPTGPSSRDADNSGVAGGSWPCN